MRPCAAPRHKSSDPFSHPPTLNSLTNTVTALGPHWDAFRRRLVRPLEEVGVQSAPR